MAKSKSALAKPPSASLMVRLDAEAKASLFQAAQLRGVSLSDYVRSVTVSQAQREIAAAANQTLVLTPAEQLEFWRALNEPVKLTKAQRLLGAMARGDA